MMTATTSNIITEEEYLRLEERSTVRHEFINGKMYEMPGGLLTHEHVIANILFLLKFLGLKAFAQGVSLRNMQTGDHYYPDVVITNEKIAKVRYIEQPLLIAEVLSPSTRAYDLADKFIAYRQFESLLYYLTVEPDFCAVNVFFKNEGGEWESEVYNQLSGTIRLLKLSIELPVSGIYIDLNWAEKA
jgi:Uma2 family endonuclease